MWAWVIGYATQALEDDALPVKPPSEAKHNHDCYAECMDALERAHQIWDAKTERIRLEKLDWCKGCQRYKPDCICEDK